MSLRDILAELDIEVRGLGDVDAANAEIDRYVASVTPAQSAFEGLRVKQQEAAEMAGRLMRKIRELQKAEGDHSKEILSLRGAFLRAQEAARSYGREADALRKSEQDQVTATTGSGGLVSSYRAAAGAIATVVASTMILRQAMTATIDLFAEIIAEGDELEKTATRLGVTSRALQEWQFIAERADVTNEELAGAFRQLSRNAESGTGPWRRLGISVRDSNHQLRSQEDLFEDAIVSLSRVESATQRSAYAQQLFGDAGAKMLTIVEGGAEGIEELRARFEELGGGLSEDVVRASAEAEDAMIDFRLATLGVRNALAVDVLPVIGRLITTAADLVAEFAELLRTSSILEVGLGALAVALVLLANVAAPILIPLALLAAVFAAIFLVVEDVVTAFRGGESVIGGWVERLFEAVGVTTTFAGILEKMAAGWTILRGRALETIGDILIGIRNLQAALGVEIFSGLDSSIADLGRRALEARNQARFQLKQNAANEAARFADRTLVRAERANEAAGTTVNAQINVTGNHDPDATARAVRRELSASMRGVADAEALAEPV